jgi:hypothetical protein
LSTISLGDTPEAWRSAGFRVDDGAFVLRSTTVRLTSSGSGFDGWAIDGVDGPIDGLPSAPPSPRPEPGSGHPNGIERIDHVVVRTGDCERTTGAFTDAGLEVRGGRSTTSYGAPMRQVFFWAGDVIVELVGPDTGEPTTDEPTSVFGLALASRDLDATAEHLGDLLGSPRDAVQSGRRIAGLRTAQLGIGLPIAVMSPHVRAPADVQRCLGGPQATDG